MPDTKELTQSQSLFQLEHELVELMALREEMAEAGEDVTACDQQIAEYINVREPAKADSCGAHIRHGRMVAAAARAEAARLNAIADQWEKREEYLKERWKFAMEQFDIKRIEGKNTKLLLRGNGGFAPLTITDESLIPEELCEYRGVISGQAWNCLRMFMVGEDAWINWSGRADVQMERHPNNGKIREALRRGPVAGVREDPRGTSLVVR